ncbi:hypothetical protein LWI28_005583 [Acer negundo]|uniref:Pentatricopeptide repeat-containing protein n=1 Tax=Acer negundo TaxID=4023 RepID=A0AAD5IT39_ACENE|nr:hypothetical protein LWI28_005583 [Acer negundo]
MKWEYHIEPEIEYYSCMVNLFARADCQEEAVNLIEEMPFQADSSMWSSIVGGCTVHGDKNLGKKVAKQIIEFDPMNSGAYVQLLNIFATSGEWERSLSVRKAMRDKQVQKNLGCSWFHNGKLSTVREMESTTRYRFSFSFSITFFLTVF